MIDAVGEFMLGGRCGVAICVFDVAKCAWPTRPKVPKCPNWAGRRVLHSDQYLATRAITRSILHINFVSNILSKIQLIHSVAEGRLDDFRLLGLFKAQISRVEFLEPKWLYPSKTL